MQVFSDADIKSKNIMPYSLKRLLISCLRKSYWSFEQGNVTSSKIYQIHLILLAYHCIMCKGINIKCVMPLQLPVNSPLHLVLQ